MLSSKLPSHQQFTNDSKLGGWEPLGENVCSLLSRRSPLGYNSLFLSDVGSEEMVLQGQVLVPWGHFGNIDQGEAALVVLKDGGADKAGCN